jgi:hypothetical protein
VQRVQRLFSFAVAAVIASICHSRSLPRSQS